MPHIHTQPNQHDMTVSAYIVRKEDSVWKCMVHFHKKMEVLMQIGGHIELDETPWQAMAHELEEESGYTLDQLELLQYSVDRVREDGNISHPIPFTMNTHNVGDQHYHSDLCYGFIASELQPEQTRADESDDIRWLTIEQLKIAADSGEALMDVYYAYLFLVEHMQSFSTVATNVYSLAKPSDPSITYKRGRAGSDE